MNIVDMMRSTLGAGGTTNAISSLLGLSNEQTERATSATIPALLAGIAGVASTPRGAEQLSDTIGRQDPGMLDNVSNTLSRQGGQIAEQGQNVLSSLMGSGTSSMLGGVLSKFTGLGEGATGKLLAVCAPLILGVLGKQQRSMGTDASGLANFLSGQKDNIRAAMPAGLDSALSKVPGLGQFLGSQPAMASSPSTDRARLSAQSSERGKAYAPADSEKSSLLKWAIPLLFGIAVLGGLMFWSRHRHEGGVGGAGTEQQTIRGEETSATSEASQLVTQAASVLSGVKDSASAEAAVPRLKAINDGLGRLHSLSSELPESTRSTMKETLKPALEKLEAAAQPVLNMPGVGDTVRPYVQQLVSHVNSLTQ